MRAFEFLDDVGSLNTNTMVLDKGMSYNNIEDMLKLTGDYFNLLKYGWGTSILYNQEIIKDKNELYHSYNIKTYVGGTLFELANKKDKIDEYFNEIDKLNFNAVEISDGSTTISSEKRLELITKSKELGFYTLSEIGKKNPEKDKEYSLEQRINLINKDIEAGSDMVIIEGRESGKNIGIYDSNGNVKLDEIDEISMKTKTEKLLWEAPQKNQQIALILKLGNTVNLGNINSNDIISLETLRRGLRGDTLGKV
ncbi:phosphosulfolactate synthase [Methanosphaera sp. WGK6]|uniref:phosphosulfolactate synthase n=1 Tax=Methanosphaera sp. WGK6 TaxID=1561964 RepID=UPI00084C7B90|nr:phosphosulfolactate synthase [Methanosphaera sp. WGK6]OED30663.1 phosphosulfolactate synthase [Methanosphaera sp. WGK6]